MNHLILSLKKWREKILFPVSFIGPAFLIVALLTIYPLAFVVRMSLSEWTYGKPMSEARYVGLRNFIGMFSKNSSLLHALKLTLFFLFSAVVIELILGMLIAILLNNQKIKKASFMMGILIIPMLMMPAMVGTIQRLFFHPTGIINYIIESLSGHTINWYSTDFAMIAVIIADIWQWTPFFILTIFAGLQALPKEPYEAAMVDGANMWQKFKLVTLPLISPVLVVSTLIRSMECLRNFDMIFNFFGGGPGNATETLPVYIYRQTIYGRMLGEGSAAGLVLVAIMLCGTFVLMKALRKANWSE